MSSSHFLRMIFSLLLGATAANPFIAFTCGPCFSHDEIVNGVCIREDNWKEANCSEPIAVPSHHPAYISVQVTCILLYGAVLVWVICSMIQLSSRKNSELYTLINLFLVAVSCFMRFLAYVVEPFNLIEPFTDTYIGLLILEITFEMLSLFMHCRSWIFLKNTFTNDFNSRYVYDILSGLWSACCLASMFLTLNDRSMGLKIFLFSNIVYLFFLVSFINYYAWPLLTVILSDGRHVGKRKARTLRPAEERFRKKILRKKVNHMTRFILASSVAGLGTNIMLELAVGLPMPHKNRYRKIILFHITIILETILNCALIKSIVGPRNQKLTVREQQEQAWSGTASRSSKSSTSVSSRYSGNSKLSVTSSRKSLKRFVSYGSQKDIRDGSVQAGECVQIIGGKWRGYVGHIINQDGKALRNNLGLYGVRVEITKDTHKGVWLVGSYLKRISHRKSERSKVKKKHSKDEKLPNKFRLSSQDISELTSISLVRREIPIDLD